MTKSNTPELHKSVYIPSLEASDIYSHINRGLEINIKHIGMIPASLELNKLIQEGLKVSLSKSTGKRISDDLINVNFKSSVKSADDLIEINEEKISKLANGSDEYETKLTSLLDKIKAGVNDDPEHWEVIKVNTLRETLYRDGFTLNGNDRYVVYKRSSAKSRTGKCLFIKEHLYDKMIKWSRMGLAMVDHLVDFPSLLAYESLVGSSLKSLIKIHPRNILIVDDVYSTFTWEANVVRKGKNGFLDSFEESAEISNNLFDGEAILDSRYFPKDTGMMLLRNHMFKSCAFNCNLQQYLKNNCPNGIPYRQWKLVDMFGNEVPAISVHLVITPSSLKALKFASVVGSGKAMYEYWKQIVLDEQCVFGVVKSEKESKHGLDSEGNLLQQTSYQMINSLPISQDEIKELVQFELDYIDSLKNDDSTFIEYLVKTANDANSHEMMAQLYHKNKRIVGTSIFKKFRREAINAYVSRVRKGKVRVNGDYCVMIGNPMEYLAHAIGKYDENKLALKGNEIHTSLFSPDTTVVGFRNPHTAPSNILVAENVIVSEIEKYFNLTNNIVCVNAIGFPIQTILSGADYDSDSVLLSHNPILINAGNRANGEYRIAYNMVDSDNVKPYQIDSTGMATIDNILSQSQKNIGQVVNKGQLCMSLYWDGKAKGNADKELYKKIDVLTVLSEIAIDLAKKMYDVDFAKELRNIKGLRNKRPLFWKAVNKKTNKTRLTRFECPMDYLQVVVEKPKYANQIDNVSLGDLVYSYNTKKEDRKQIEKVIKYAEELKRELKEIKDTSQNDEDKNEVYNDIDNVIKQKAKLFNRLTVKEDTMKSIIHKICENKYDSFLLTLLNSLYKSQKTIFLKAFVDDK